MNTRHRVSLPLAALAMAALSLALLVAAPRTARADYSLPSVDIEATVLGDGTLAVEETRTFDFYDDINGVYWTIPFAENQQGKTSEVTIDGVTVDDTAFSQVSTASKGDDGVYTADVVSESGEKSLKLKVFMPRYDGDTATVTVSYEMTGAVMAWSDTAELYWKFIGPDWSADSENVNLTVRFEDSASSGVAATKKTLRAWGHGALTGNVAPDVESSLVTYEMRYVESGSYAEARVAFPTAWVPDLSAQGEERLSTIISEEKEWANEANAKRRRARLITAIAGLAIAVASMVFAGVVLVLRITRRRPKPVFDDDYFRDVPSADHPAVLAMLASPEYKVPSEAFTATLMKLTDDRVISLSQLSAEPGPLGFKGKDDYQVTMANGVQTIEANGNKITPIDQAALELFFTGADYDIEQHAWHQTFKGFKKSAKKHTTNYGLNYEAYEQTVTAALEERGLVASDGKAARDAGVVIALVIALAGFFVNVTLDFASATRLGLFVGVPFLIAGALLARGFKRLTQEGCEVEAKCQALKRWLEDFTRLNEAVPGDLVLWNKLMVMAVALGVSKKTLRELADAVPRAVRERDDFYDYYPVYWWCYPHAGLHEPASNLGAAYNSSVAALAASSDSSGDGFGGGFSGGGGGGVGGGGGGTF